MYEVRQKQTIILEASDVLELITETINDDPRSHLGDHISENWQKIDKIAWNVDSDNKREIIIVISL